MPVFNPASRIADIDNALTGYVTTQLDFYVATTGSDSNSGLSAGSPFLTIQKALDSIPTLLGGICQINIADGTYTNAATLTNSPIFGRTGNSSLNTVVKIVGNTTTPANVIIKPPTATTTCFSFTGIYCLWDFDGFLVQNCGSAFSFNNARAIFRAVNADQHRGVISAINYSIITTDSNAATPFVWTGVANVAFNGVSSRSNSSVVIAKASTITGFSSSGRAINVDTGGTLTVNPGFTHTWTAGSSGGRFGMTVGTNSTATLSGTFNISDVSTITSSTVGGIRLFAGAAITFGSGSIFNFTNCYKAIVIEPTAVWNDLATITVNYTTCTTKLEMNHGGVANSTDLVGATGGISYVAALNTAPIFGYDDRYQKVGSPTEKRTAVADANYAILVTDAIVAYSSLTAARTVTIPAVATATANITAGQVRKFVIKDESGNCSAVNTITISGVNIDGAASYIINLPYGSVEIYTVSGGSAYFTR